MFRRRHRSLNHPEAGGITIVVTLMLLVLLTVAAVAMSKNALREMIVSGTSRQGSEVRGLADSGLEYSIYWMIQERENRPAVNATVTTGYQGLINTMDRIRDQSGPSGSYYRIGTSADMTVTPASGKTGTFDVWLLNMWKLPTTGNSRLNELLEPDLWALRSNAVLDYGGAMQFQHNRETWISTSVRQ